MRAQYSLIFCVTLATACTGETTSELDASVDEHFDAGGDDASSDGGLSDADIGVDGATDGSVDGSTGEIDAGVAEKTDLERLEALIVDLGETENYDARLELVDEFFTEIAYGERGFPIREDGVLAVALYDDLYDEAGGALSVSGDFNGWEASADMLIQPILGFAFFYQIVSVTEPLPRTLYKFVRDGSEWFADPKARRFGWDSYGEYSLAEAGDEVSHMERWPTFDKGVGALSARDVVVYVPAGHEAASGLKVLYMHDGQNLFDPNAFYGGWQANTTADELIGDGTLSPFLMVGIDNTADRMDEYTHVPDDLGYDEPVGGRADEYLAFVTTGIKPFVDERYHTDPAPESTAVVGSSLGGLVSFYASWLYPDIFGHAASMSGTFGWGDYGLGNPTMMELYESSAPDGVNLYLDSGGEYDPSCSSGNDNYCVTIEMADTLRDLGWVDGVDLLYYWDEGASHNETFWAARFPMLLEDWFPKSGS